MNTLQNPLTKICHTCNQTFCTVKNNQKRCPRCLAQKHNRTPAFTPVARECLHSFICTINLPQSLFSLGQSHDHHSDPYLRATLKGSIAFLEGWNSSNSHWDGRLDIYCNATNLPRIARVRVMRTTKASGYVKNYLAIDTVPGWQLPTHLLMLCPALQLDDNPSIYRDATWSFSLMAHGPDGQENTHYVLIAEL